MTKVTAMETFGDFEGIAMRMAIVVEPAAIIETAGLDHERIAIPFADRVTQPGGNHIVRETAAVGEHLAVPVLKFVKDQRHPWMLDDFPWSGGNGHRVRYTVRQ